MYNRWPEDIALMKKLGVKNYRHAWMVADYFSAATTAMKARAASAHMICIYRRRTGCCMSERSSCCCCCTLQAVYCLDCYAATSALLAHASKAHDTFPFQTINHTLACLQISTCCYCCWALQAVHCLDSHPARWCCWQCREHGGRELVQDADQGAAAGWHTASCDNVPLGELEATYFVPVYPAIATVAAAAAVPLSELTPMCV
jgi:hypothetical protein